MSYNIIIITFGSLLNRALCRHIKLFHFLRCFCNCIKQLYLQFFFHFPVIADIIIHKSTFDTRYIGTLLFGSKVIGVAYCSICFGL